MVLDDLSTDFNKATLPDKDSVVQQLSGLLPPGSFMVMIRNYAAGDARTNTQEKHQSFQLVISLRRAGREAALQKKEELEALGYTVSLYGELNLN